ncbi:MAG: 6-bladed beta-propeller [Gammaproteobacteria bacterium]|nr:6-bladed beta-propeller [Gammaproteobacteria bacterium]
MNNTAIIIRRLFGSAALTFMLCVGIAASGAAADPQDNGPIYYPDPPNQPRLQFLAKFSSPLDIATKKSGFRDFLFGGEDNEGHLVQKPYGVAIYEGAIYVVDTRGNGWAVFDVSSKSSRFVRPAGPGALRKPINITIDTDGTRYVTDTERKQVIVYDRNDRYARALGQAGDFSPVDVAIHGDRLYVTDVEHHQVHILDKASGSIVKTFGGAGSEPGKLFHPTNLTITPAGTLYVVDTTNFRLQEFTRDGGFLRTIGKIGTGPGTFSRPKGVAVDRENHIYVVDSAFENVQILDGSGGALMYFGSPGDARDSINMPTVVKIDYENVRYFEHLADPGFRVEYLVVVASQFGLNKIAVFGFGGPRE